MNAHTPGPWRVARHAEFLVKVETRNAVICDALGKLNEETLANASLIAAAPDLLAALEACVSAGAALQAGKRGGEVMGKVGIATDAARLAIAKARGES